MLATVTISLGLLWKVLTEPSFPSFLRRWLVISAYEFLLLTNSFSFLPSTREIIDFVMLFLSDGPELKF